MSFVDDYGQYIKSDFNDKLICISFSQKIFDINKQETFTNYWTSEVIF